MKKQLFTTAMLAFFFFVVSGIEIKAADTEIKALEAKGDVILNGSDIVMYYLDGTQYITVLTDMYGSPIVDTNLTFTVNGIDYVRTTDENGTASMSINLDPGEYEITASFSGNEIYNEATPITNTITVLGTIFAYDEGTIYRVEVLNIDGSPLANVDIDVQLTDANNHQSNYVIISDANGIAQLDITFLQPGTYTAIATHPHSGLQVSTIITVHPNSIKQNYIHTKVCPNPVECGQFLTVKTQPLSNAILEVFNSTGMQVRKRSIIGESAIINMPAIPGVYLLKISTSESEEAVKVIVK